MRNQLVYDLPVRLFHWIFAGLFVGAFLIAKTVDDESPLFSYHMLAGLLLVFTVLLRIVWGFLGSANSRFSSFALKPQDLVVYFSGIISGEKHRWAGHNPASSWATFAMFALALGLGTTGYLMASGSQETFEDVHELMANGFLVVVLLHVAGVLLHGFRHRDGIGFSMVDGRKMDVPVLNIQRRVLRVDPDCPHFSWRTCWFPKKAGVSCNCCLSSTNCAQICTNGFKNILKSKTIIS